jgi:rRNA maturation RNase YbeY
MPSTFNELDIKAGLKNKRKLSGLLDELVKVHKGDVKDIELTYIFCNDEYLLQLNQRFLKHDTLTDILTFDQTESNDNSALKGEIYISVERVKENSEKFKTPYQQELLRVIFHGLLHLCGFKDKTKADKKEMRTHEDTCLAICNVRIG